MISAAREVAKLSKQFFCVHFWFVMLTISGSHDVSISGTCVPFLASKGIGSKSPHFTPTVKTDECQTHSFDIKNQRQRNTLWDARTHRPEVFLRSDCAPKSLPRSLSMPNFIFRFCFFFLAELRAKWREFRMWESSGTNESKPMTRYSYSFDCVCISLSLSVSLSLSS